MKSISPEKLELAPGIQSRAQLDMVVIQEYAEAMQNGAQFPPVQAISENDCLWVWDGFHRVLAAKSAGVAIYADIRPGTFREAQWLASGANKSHGLRRSNADKRRAVEMALKANASKSDSEIARHCGVSIPTVSNMRVELELSLKILKISKREVVRNGTTYMQDVARIGKSQRQEQIPTEQWERDNRSLGLDFFGDPLPDSEPIIEPTIERKPVFNRTNENIEWAAWSWNPVTGCKHGCDYCYARDIANRFYPQGFEPTFHSERLAAPTNTKSILQRWSDDKGHKGVFVCSMADLFGDWVPQEWIDAVLEATRDSPQWNFIFLTKNPKRLVDIGWPSNAWVGTTIDVQTRVKQAEDAFSQFDATKKFVSCEPMLEQLQFSRLDVFDWVIIGGRSKNSKLPEFQPNPWWAINLSYEARKSGCQVYWKTNLTTRLREYP